MATWIWILYWPHFYQTRSAWSMDQGSNKNHSPVNNCAPTVTKFCVMWEGQALPHDTKFSNCRDKIVDSRAFLSWSLIHGSSWSGLIKLGPGSSTKPLSEPKLTYHPCGSATFNTLRPRQNGRHLLDDIFKWIFLNENVWISIKISLKFVPRGPISNIPALVQIMAWRRPGDKPLSEPMMVNLLTPICVTRPQWVNWGKFHNRYGHRSLKLSWTYLSKIQPKSLRGQWVKSCFVRCS